MHTVFLGIGSNLGDRKKNLTDVTEKIIEFIGRVTGISSVYETVPWGFSAENDFLNIVLKVETLLSPSELLRSIFMVEEMLGRVRNGDGYVSRTMDIDILLYEDRIIDNEDLKIPHPLMHERKFALVPLCEIDPELIHPVKGKSMRLLLEECTDAGGISKI
jgi:2-amino-4-hydroxy-6-hydroxymethyldihydropteridine diphosphokinase